MNSNDFNEELDKKRFVLIRNSMLINVMIIVCTLGALALLKINNRSILLDFLQHFFRH
jgi:hypothetical protein